MSTTVLDALLNAQVNLETVGRRGAGHDPIFMIAMEQLRNGITALENGKQPDDIIQDHAFGPIDLVSK